MNDSRTTVETLGTVLQSADEFLIRSPSLDELISLLTKLIDEGRNIEIDAEHIVNHGYMQLQFVINRGSINMFEILASRSAYRTPRTLWSERTHIRLS